MYKNELLNVLPKHKTRKRSNGLTDFDTIMVEWVVNIYHWVR